MIINHTDNLSTSLKSSVDSRKLVDSSRNHSYINSQPQTLIVSMRGFHHEVYRSAEYEFEDAIASFDSANIMPILANSSGHLNYIKKKFSNYLGLHFKANHLLNSGCQDYHLQQEYDVFFFVCQHFWDITALNSIRNWRENSRYAVAWIDEIWACELLESKTQLCIQLLKEFDVIFTTQSSSAEAIAKLTQKPCISIPYGVDTIKFAPVPNTTKRHIDVYSIGRRSPKVHQALLRLTQEENFLYVYDSLKALQMYHYQEHRTLYSNLIKRTRYYIANKAKFDQPQQTGGQEEIGARFFEGAAGGSIMIGTPPQCKAFQQNFDWQDAVIPIPTDAENIVELLIELDSQPQRLESIRKQNVINALLRHDWVYRWQTILKILGLKTTPAMEERISYLQHLANSIHDYDL